LSSAAEEVEMRQATIPLVLAVLASACASKTIEADRPATASQEWSAVEKLPVGTAVRVTNRAGDRAYGRVMAVTDLRLTLELEAGSLPIARDEIVLVERFPTSFPMSIQGAAVGVGAALSLSASSTPETYRRSVAPAQETLDKASTPLRDGVYVDALELVGTTAERVSKAIENTRKTVVVYRARE
jgi:hypothetical protein